MNSGGTTIIISGLKGQYGQIASSTIQSKQSCFDSACYAVLDQSALFSQASGTLQTTIIECLSPMPSEDLCTQTPNCIWFSFDVQNPLISTGDGVILTASTTNGIIIPPLQFPISVLSSGLSGNITYFSVNESTKEAGSPKYLKFQNSLNVRPLAGTSFVISNLVGSLTPSGSLPIRIQYEDMTEQLLSAVWNPMMGILSLTLVIDPPVFCSVRSKCTFGHTLSIQVLLINPKRASLPVQPVISASVCLTSQCRTESKLSVISTYASSSVFSSSLPCSQALDLCGVCGGDNSICVGCDGKPNSGSQVDMCGVCGGTNLCLGCDGVVNSGKKIDACGICGSTGTQCNPNSTSQIVWPAVLANFSISGLNQTEKISINQKLLIRQAFAAALGIKVDSVDILQMTSIQTQRSLGDGNLSHPFP